MVYRDFQDKKMSWLGMGNMRLPLTEGANPTIDKVKAQEIIDYAMANGINYYDTAVGYHSGESEVFLGEALEKYPRSNYYLATKFSIFMNPDYKAVFEEQLARLKTNYIDFYLIHAIMDNNFQSYIDSGCIQYFAEQKALGRIKHLGFSTHASIENFETFVNQHEWDFCLQQLNAYDWIYGNSKQKYDILTSKGIPTIAMGPVRGGRIAKLSPEAEAILKEARPAWTLSEWAFRWVKNRDNNFIALSGMTTLEQITENVRLFQDDRGLTEDEEQIFYKALEAFKKEMQAPCTDCNYCIDSENCPVKINIPRFLQVYNTYKVDGDFGLRKKIENVDSPGNPSDCVFCDKCNKKCPQTIDIVSIMRELGEYLD
ncbi:MAG: aldo/keto reductase [Defluviitaleaceae bacterium]|nr:aldo/keto reductase [Defluviitaleaceae bacterium]